MRIFAACALLLAAPAGCAPAPRAAAPAAPAPATAARQPRAFIIFHDYESDAIAPQAAAILANVVLAWRAGGAVRLIVSGHANRSHSSADSLDISRRRAWRVHDWLLDAGVPEAALAVHYYGEERPLVDTSDGVREPQNRRVEILFEEAGHADRAGAANYNLGLSRRRAEALRDHLLAAGLGPRSIDPLQASDETRPQIETPDGAADPRNRRAEVLFYDPTHPFRCCAQ